MQDRLGANTEWARSGAVRVIAAQLFSVSSSGAVHAVAALAVPSSIVDTPRGPGSQTAMAGRRREPVLVADWGSERTYSAPGVVHGLGIGSTLAIPLVAGEECFVLELHAHSPRAFYALQTELAAALLHVPPLQALSDLFAAAYEPDELVRLLDGWIAELGDRRSELSAVAIRDAMLDGRLLLYGQPILDLRADQVMQTELLVRLRGEDGSVLSPDRFLPAAERAGLVSALDRWVLEHACRLAGTGQRVQMNVAARTMSERGFVEAARRALVHHDAAPYNLTFEITETELIRDLDAAQASAERLVSTGCAFALDDFGTGFAPLMYLKRLPIAYLKIGIDFVRDVVTDGRSQTLLRAVVELAGALRLGTIAEGVEDEETLRFLRRVGVDFAQGHHIGRETQLV